VAGFRARILVSIDEKLLLKNAFRIIFLTGSKRLAAAHRFSAGSGQWAGNGAWSNSLNFEPKLLMEHVIVDFVEKMMVKSTNLPTLYQRNTHL
jgi:hypothetical protein